VGACHSPPLATSQPTPDGIAYVGATREVWATVGAPPLGVSPPDKAIVILDASIPGTLKHKGRVAIDGEAEGYAVDEAGGLFYTNLADKEPHRRDRCSQAQDRCDVEPTLRR
jgi:hypothetical protein